MTTTTTRPATEPVRRRGYAVPAPVMSIAQARAALSVRRAITRVLDDGLTVPCVDDPAGWDADLPVSKAARAGLERVVRLCLTGCPVLETCRAFLATDPPVGGVCAGTYRLHQGEKQYGETKREWAALTAADLANEAGRAAA